MEGHYNPAYSSEVTDIDSVNYFPQQITINGKPEKHRDNWGNGIEFLLSCIAMSVGLGNVWRFPFTALENGGGAFLIPYIIILVLVGRPGYYLEMIIGQFSSREIIKAFDCVPAMRGIAIGQVFCVVCVSTYYSSILAITLKYFFYSFNSVLPWSECNPLWIQPCYPSSGSSLNQTWKEGTKSSTELYFINEVLHAKENINDGIGWPNLSLLGFLILNWTIVFLILVKGIKSAGKVSYITGIAPFIFLVIFLIRALTLPGSFEGIVYFFSPNWENAFSPKVWYAAATQLFFSLNVFFANIVMYASYNKIDHNIYRDANVVTTIDTFTSIISGCISFAIIGHLKYELKVDDITKVIKGGPGLVFVTYPETISKFKFVPQVYSVFFFLMIFILGVGSIVAMMSCVITVVRDQFPKIKYWQAALGYAIFGVICSSLYVTPGGSAVIDLVDHYGANFIAFILAFFEIISFSYIYGVKRICKDVQFMIGHEPGLYWKACWYVVAPVIMGSIVLSSLINYKHPTYNGLDFPLIAHIIGWSITFSGIMWLPLMMFIEIGKKDGQMIEKIKAAFRPKANWGPLKAENYEKYQEFMKNE